MSRIDDINYFSDSRVRAKRSEIPYITLDDGSEQPLPWMYEVCDLCNGHGKHVNPSIDSGGLSEEMMDDPEFLEEYMTGTYDVECHQCGGKRVVYVADWSRMTDEQRTRWNQEREWEEQYEAERMYELRMGC